MAAEFGFLVRDPEGQAEESASRQASPPTVAAILAKSPAERAGLQVGDTLVEVNGRPVPTLQAARDALLAASLEWPLSLVVRRESERVPLVLTTTSPKL